MSFTTLQQLVNCLLDVNHLINSIISEKSLELTRDKMKMWLNIVKKVKALIDKPLDELELGHVRLAMAKVKCPHKLDISVFYRLTKRFPYEDLNYDDERFLIHFYDTFCDESIKLLGKTVRHRTDVLCHLLAKTGKEPNADQFHFMKGPSHQRTEEEINLAFEHLGWNYSPVQLD